MGAVALDFSSEKKKEEEVIRSSGVSKSGGEVNFLQRVLQSDVGDDLISRRASPHLVHLAHCLDHDDCGSYQKNLGEK